MTARVVAGGVLVLLVSVAAFVLILVGSERQDDARQKVADLAAVTSEAHALQTRVIELQTGLRGYAITGERRFLAPRDEAVLAIPAIERRLSARVDDRSMPLLDRIYREIENFSTNYVAREVELARTEGVDSIAATIRTGKGRRLVTRIKGSFGRFLATQEAAALDAKQEADDAAETATRISIAALVLTPFLIGLVVLLVARLVVRPVKQVSAAAQRLADGELSARVDDAGPAEIGSLARSFNSMASDLQQNQSELEERNEELESFSYSVSHDLRAPLRSIDGFSQALIEDCGDSIDEQGRDYLSRIRRAAGRMSEQIDDLLRLSRVSRSEVRREPVDLSELTHEVVAELAEAEPERTVQVRVEDGLWVDADRRLLRVALENLVGNAWKFTSGGDSPRIEVASEANGEGPAFFVRDNGAGFDMAYADKLFGVFQRLHSVSEFEGTGVGLATVQRVVTKHGGRVWAEAEVGRGATFHFTLGEQDKEAQHGEQQRGDSAGGGQP